jgi:hypothetical protein
MEKVIEYLGEKVKSLKFAMQKNIDYPGINKRPVEDIQEEIDEYENAIKILKETKI